MYKVFVVFLYINHLTFLVVKLMFFFIICKQYNFQSMEFETNKETQEYFPWLSLLD